MSFGAFVDARDDHNSTALTISAEFGHLDIVEELIKSGNCLEYPL